MVMGCVMDKFYLQRFKTGMALDEDVFSRLGNSIRINNRMDVECKALAESIQSASDRGSPYTLADFVDSVFGGSGELGFDFIVSVLSDGARQAIASM